MVIDAEDIGTRWLVPYGQPVFVWTGKYGTPRYDAPGTFGERFIPPSGETNISVLVVEVPDGAGIDQRDAAAAVGTRAPAGFLGLSGDVPLVLIHGYPLDNGGYCFELVPAAEYVGCEYRVERGADGVPVVRVIGG